jgi:hypothetical protein
MGCSSCGGGRRRASARPSNFRSVQATRALSGRPQGNPAAGNPTLLRAMGLQATAGATPSTNGGRMDAQRRRIERLRRDAIRKSLGK